MSDSYEFEVQVFDERCDLGHYVDREVFGDFSGDGVGVVRLFRSGTEWNRWNGRSFAALRMTVEAEELVGDVNLGGTVFGGGFVFQDSGEGEVKSGDGRQLFAPFLGCIDVREHEDFAALED